MKKLVVIATILYTVADIIKGGINVIEAIQSYKN